jgi:hypothetical protein
MGCPKRTAEEGVPMIRQVKSILVAGLLVWGTASCSDSTAELRPCPPKGIGVEDYGGYTVSEQITEYQQYDCQQPHICPDDVIALYQPEYLIDVDGVPAQSTIGLTNCSTGNQKLVIDRAILVGDSRCSFTCQCRRDKQEPCDRCQVSIQKSEVDPGETISVMIEYQPTSPGADHAAFHIYSNAQNFAPSVTPMCAWAVTSLSSSGTDDAGVDDAGAADAAASADSGSNSRPQCELVTEVNTTCHQD